MARITYNNGRTGKDGVYSANHNDRSFDVSTAKNIDVEKVSNNVYWQMYKDMTFAENELQYYKKHFLRGLNARNERNIAYRHPERNQTIEEYITNPKTCPEETLLYIGNKDDDIDPSVIKDILTDYLNWQSKKYPLVKTLDWAYHVDEQGAPHIHERHVFVAKDKFGFDVVNQKQALVNMGIQRPHPQDKSDRYNNEKVTYTKICREMLQSIAQGYGIDITTEPREKSQSGLELIQYKYLKTQEELERVSAEHNRITLERDALQKECNLLKTENMSLKVQIDDNTIKAMHIPDRPQDIEEPIKFKELVEESKNNYSWYSYNIAEKLKLKWENIQAHKIYQAESKERKEEQLLWDNNYGTITDIQKRYAPVYNEFVNNVDVTKKDHQKSLESQLESLKYESEKKKAEYYCYKKYPLIYALKKSYRHCIDNPSVHKPIASDKIAEHEYLKMIEQKEIDTDLGLTCFEQEEPLEPLNKLLEPLKPFVKPLKPKVATAHQPVRTVKSQKKSKGYDDYER